MVIGVVVVVEVMLVSLVIRDLFRGDAGGDTVLMNLIGALNLVWGWGWSGAMVTLGMMGVVVVVIL